MAQFPVARMRRLRASETTRRMVRETHVSVDDLIYPLFVAEGSGLQREISAMPGNYHWSVDTLPRVLDETSRLGVPAVLLFGIPDEKDAVGTQAYAEEGIVQQAVRAIKRHNPELLVVTDVCLCEYTSHGHCGIVTPEGRLLNDPTLELLQKTAVSHAQAGADVIAPSDMMDGRVGAIRSALDANGFDQVPVMSYAAKYASGFYGPFREAAGSAPQFGDRRSYQMDPANRREALREIALDVEEGADILMVKPALSYLDIIREARDRFDLPIAAYNVSGEYSMVKAAAANGWVDGERIMMEILTSIKRAGADILITYHALEAASVLRSA